MKIAPIIKAIKTLQSQGKGQIAYRLVHTGQHYDKKMSSDFFDQIAKFRYQIQIWNQAQVRRQNKLQQLWSGSKRN